MSKIVKMLAGIATAMFFVACSTESEKVTSTPKGSGVIDFQIGGVSSIETKSGAAKVIAEEQIEKISLSEDQENQDLFLVGTVSDLDSYLYADNAVTTKGTPVYTQNFASIYDNIGGIAKQYESTSSEPTEFTHTPDEFGLVAESPLRYRYDFGEANKDWPQGKSLLFYLSAPNWDDISSEAVSNIEYGQEVSKIKNQNDKVAWNGTIAFDFITPETAEKQVDYLFTTKSLAYEDYHQVDNATPVVLFYHALAGVKFKTAKANDQITVITKVEITNINSTGRCVVTPKYDEEGYDENNSNTTAQVTKSAGCVAWASVDTPLSFTLEGLTNSNVVSAADGQFPSSFNGGNGTLGTNNLNDASFTKTFFFIPQTTSADSKITVYYDIYSKGMGEKLESAKRVVNFGGQKWEAGKLYTYTLSPNHVTVKITDKMDTDAKIKSNVVIKNTGNTDSYIRVALMGNWYDTHSPAQIVAPWGSSNVEGTFTGFDNTNWTYSETDGYYYYNYIVKAGETLQHPLFSTYTVGKCPVVSVENTAHLEIDILVQAVDAAKTTKIPEGAWNCSFSGEYDK